MTKKLLDIAAEIIQAQASVGQMTPTQIEEALIKTFSTLQKMQKAEDKGLLLDIAGMAEGAAGEGMPSWKQDPKTSIQDDKITCLECGTQMRQLTARHLSSHSLTPREYKKKWGFSFKQPLSAKSLTKARSKAAKKRGLPENLVKFLEQKKQEKAMAAKSAPAPEAAGNPPSKSAVKRRPGKQS